MGGKLSPIIIVVLLVLVIVIAIVVYGVVTGTGGFTNNSNSNTQQSENTVATPVLSLKKKDIDEDSEEKNLNSVTITVTATTEDKDGIAEITLPDKTTVKGDTATFEATENKKYSFSATGVNGEVGTGTIEVTEIAEISASNPYVPTGFTVINEDVDKGFVIQDEAGNQYVWVPVESGKLTREMVLNGKYEESSTSATSLVNSVAKYYGFYIARFETSEYDIDGESVAASMSGKIPWTNITYLDAVNYANDSATKFEYEDGCSTALMNSYAWDTVLKWIDINYENYSQNTNYGNYDYTVYPTGTTESDTVNNICDLAGNVREWTTEIYKDSASQSNDNIKQRVIRGGSANLSRTPSSHIGYAENTSDTYWGFRMILYKQ